MVTRHTRKLAELQKKHGGWEKEILGPFMGFAGQEKGLLGASQQLLDASQESPDSSPELSGSTPPFSRRSKQEQT